MRIILARTPEKLAHRNGLIYVERILIQFRMQNLIKFNKPNKNGSKI
jgi:hypothetical protein